MQRIASYIWHLEIYYGIAAIDASPQAGGMEKKRSRDALRTVVGMNVRLYRVSMKLSQEELAERCGIKRTYVGAIERAEIDVRLTTLSKLARGLNLDPYLLLIRDPLPSRR